MHSLVARLVAINSRLALGEAVRKRVIRDPTTHEITETIESRDPPLDLAAIARDANATLAEIRATSDMSEDDRILATAALVDFADLLAPLVDPASRANLARARAANLDQLSLAGARVEPR